MQRFTFEWEDTDPVQVFEAVHHRPYALFLDSADRDHSAAQKSFIFFDPLETYESGFRQLENVPGILAGYWGYDLARDLETLPQDTLPSPTPPMAVGLYDFAIEFDHVRKTCTLIIYAENETKAEERKAVIKSYIMLSRRTPGSHANSHQTPTSTGEARSIVWKNEKSKTEYEQNVQTVIDYILAGDAFQVNLSQRFTALLPDDFSPWEHYKHLRRINPAPFAAYMNAGQTIIASASPERFLTTSENGHIETRPIKGTLPRSTDPKLLEESEKDRAENIMIVDLLRNDLSKVCEPASIAVPELCKLETFASVHHLVSTVTGKIKTGKTPLDLLKACFPGGSVTGAPKIRAMEIIEELETHQRGPYCGALGYIAPDGKMDTSILIRTLVYADGEVCFNTGGGVTALSNPQTEYQETLDKARRIFESFEIKKEEAA